MHAGPLPDRMAKVHSRRVAFADAIGSALIQPICEFLV